ncbi:hypothetical protein GCM10022210_49920 [Mucilaginibacter dorajii]|uniref:Uncharacterized protein n=1 Tax=Mucilaginibacter dorajii TaxID=692994 RepID=A0ABP7QZJ5_9SPHI
MLATQNKKPLLEINVAAEIDWATNWATKGYIIKTDDKRFYLDAYFRARLPTTPWLKFSLKYDPKGGMSLAFST